MAKLEIVELRTPADDTQFNPPADAAAPPQVITLDEKTARAQLLQHAPPVYPPIAKAARVSGDVVIALQIQTDGRAGHLRVLSGPAMLQWAALERREEMDLQVVRAERRSCGSEHHFDGAIPAYALDRLTAISGATGSGQSPGKLKGFEGD